MEPFKKHRDCKKGKDNAKGWCRCNPNARDWCGCSGIQAYNMPRCIQERKFEAISKFDKSDKMIRAAVLKISLDLARQNLVKGCG